MKIITVHRPITSAIPDDLDQYDCFLSKRSLLESYPELLDDSMIISFTIDMDNTMYNYLGEF